MSSDGNNGALGWVSDRNWEAIHADWPAYPGDQSWEVALLRFGDFPLGMRFTCISVIDQCALFVADTGVRVEDKFSEKHMHVAARLDELISLDDRQLITGVTIEETLSLNQILVRRTFDSQQQWDDFRTGDLVIGTFLDGEFKRIYPPLYDADWTDDWDDGSPPRTAEYVAMYPGCQVQLTSSSDIEIERIARMLLEIPPDLDRRINALLSAGLYDSAIRDLGVSLESRMRIYTGGSEFGSRLVESYIRKLLATGDYLPARIKSLRQELRAIFKFVRNEFAHNLADLEVGRGYALISRLCWHIRDVDLLTQELKCPSSDTSAARN